MDQEQEDINQELDINQVQDQASHQALVEQVQLELVLEELLEQVLHTHQQDSDQEQDMEHQLNKEEQLAQVEQVLPQLQAQVHLEHPEHQDTAAILLHTEEPETNDLRKHVISYKFHKIFNNCKEIYI